VPRRLCSLGLIAAAAAAAANALGAPAPARAQPSASFLWFPPTPQAGETVSLASTSTDFTSPIIDLAWDLAGSGAFQEGGALLTTMFPSAGGHVVRLRVTAADGSSAVATETIHVSAPAVSEILPFPVVRIAGLWFATGVRLRLLSVEAPPGARVDVACRGRGCPARRQSRLLTSTRVENVTVTFRRFERFLRAGITLEVRVSKPGQIGKYTRIRIRSGRAPSRIDSCLEPTSMRAVRCRASA
jgi:hypothetical protein